MSIRSNRSTRRNFQPTSGLGIESAQSSRIAINLGRIDLLQCHVLRTRDVHVIVVSQVLTSDFGDALGATRVESSITSDESTHFGCIGHGWRVVQYTQRTRNVHVIVVSQLLTSSFGDVLGANGVESSITSDESTHFKDQSTSGMTIRQQGRRVVSI